MSKQRFLEKESLAEFLTWLGTYNAEEYRVLAPTKQGNSVIFMPYKAENEVCFDKAAISPKEVAFPRCETLVNYKRSKDPENLDKITMIQQLSLRLVLVMHVALLCLTAHILKAHTKTLIIWPNAKK